MFFWDPTYLMVLPALLLAFWAQSRVSKNYKKYKQVANRRGMTGVATARWILDQNNLQNVSIEMSKGRLSDHYDPRSKTVRLSPDNYNGASLAAVAIAAHECGHAIQDAREYTPLRLRTAILPVANIGSWAAFPLFIAGFIFQWTGLIQLGIAFFAMAVLFQVITLPVEFNASSRAMAIIRDNGILQSDELGGAKKVLNAAALTYVAAALMALLELLRLILISQNE